MVVAERSWLRLDREQFSDGALAFSGTEREAHDQ
jgi:hypothetical protein